MREEIENKREKKSLVKTYTLVDKYIDNFRWSISLQNSDLLNTGENNFIQIFE